MGKAKEFVVFHGTDYNIAEIIVSNQFNYRLSDEHWLGNGIYFYIDLSLAKWWTTKPSNTFGSKINKAAIIECNLSIDEDKILDLRNLDNYKEFSEIYKNEFILQVFDGNISVEKNVDTGEFNTKKLRCAFCDYLKNQYELQAIIGTFDLPTQPYLPKSYGEGFKAFSLNYIETQICVFDSRIIVGKQIMRD